MHPEILRQIARQKVADQRAQAQRSQAARTLAKALRGGHPATLEADGFVTPRIPDYVDGSFAGETAEQVPAARTAA